MSTGAYGFDLSACIGGECQSTYTFATPVTLTLTYNSTDVTGLLEDTLSVYTWNGSTWVDVVDDCPSAAYQRYPEENRLVVPLCHLSSFIIAGEPFPYAVYLPLIMR